MSRYGMPVHNATSCRGELPDGPYPMQFPHVHLAADGDVVRVGVYTYEDSRTAAEREVVRVPGRLAGIFDTMEGRVERAIRRVIKRWRKTEAREAEAYLASRLYRS